MPQWPEVPNYGLVVLAGLVVFATYLIRLPEYLSEHKRDQETYYEPSSDDDDDVSCVNIHNALLATLPRE